MFSGIVENLSEVLEATERPSGLRLSLARPSDFLDIKIGDSIAVDGVCLTVEAFDSNQITFSVGAETMRVVGWDKNLLQRKVNLERSLRLGDRMHGHLVSGHVDSRAVLLHSQVNGDSLELQFSLPAEIANLVWSKGSITVNGVSLTVNQVTREHFEVCCIPETLRRTNLAFLKIGDFVNLEADWMAKSFQHFFKNSLPLVGGPLNEHHS